MFLMGRAHRHFTRRGNVSFLRLHFFSLVYTVLLVTVHIHALHSMCFELSFTFQTMFIQSPSPLEDLQARTYWQGG
jgi:hypothetical protein